MTNRGCLFYSIICVSTVVMAFCLYYLNTQLPVTYNDRPAYAIQTFSTTAEPTSTVTIKPLNIRSAEPFYSTLTLLEKRRFKTGDKLRVTIKLRDGNGRQIRQGGDVLRLWLQEGTSNVTGEIQDHGNGKYTGTVLLPWRGRPTVHVSIANTRQQIRFVTSAIEKHGILTEVLAKFVNSENETAVSRCSPDPDVVDWGDICNLTSSNYNVPWYSEKPNISSISCFDWKYLTQGKRNYLSDQQIQWMGKHTHMVINSSVTVSVEGNDVIPASDTPCINIDRSVIWKMSVPSGFYYNGSWISTLCRPSIQKSNISSQYTTCLSDRHFFIIGDSNSRSFATYLKSLLNLTGISISGPWHQFTYWEQKNLSISVSWTPHETPFFSWPFYTKDSLKPPYMFIDEIGQQNNSVILIHMYMHFLRARPAILRSRVRLLRLSIEKLLVRSPNVTVLVKGPHASRYKPMLDPVDYFAPIHRRIWFEEFKGLYHKVIYLDMWDITAGSGSIHNHPDNSILSDMIFMFFSYVCEES